MKPNLFKAALKAGQKQVGLWLSNTDRVNAEIIAGSDYDWALLDMEHAPNSYGHVGAQLQAFAASRTTPIVRPIWNHSLPVKQLMDLGSPGLLFPMVQNAEEAQAAVAATQYPLKGIRGVAGVTRATNYGRDKAYRQEVEAETCLLLQIESKAALLLAEDIAAVDGIDGIFFGPADISADLGHGGDPTKPEVWDAIMPVAERLIAAGTSVGTLTLNPYHAKELFMNDFSFVACGMDTALLAQGADALLADVRGAL